MPDAVAAVRPTAPSLPAPAAAAAAPAPPGGLTPEQIQTLHAAQREGRKVTRAAAVATFSGWTIVVFAVITLLSGLFSFPALLLGIGMAVVAKVELSGARGLRRLDPDAPRRLGYNQLAFGAMLTLYGAWGIVAALTTPGPYEAEIAGGGQMAEMLEPIAALHVMVAVGVYGSVIVAGLAGTVGAAVYYFTRRPHVIAHLERTPAWVVETLRAVDGPGRR